MKRADIEAAARERGGVIAQSGFVDGAEWALHAQHQELLQYMDEQGRICIPPVQFAKIFLVEGDK